MSVLGRRDLRLRVNSWCHGFKSSDAIMGQDAEVRFERFVFGDRCLWPESSAPGGCMGLGTLAGPIRSL